MSPAEPIPAGAAVVGLYGGGVETFVAHDGRPLTTAIRKAPVAEAQLEPAGFRGDASAEAAHRTPDRAVHLFAEECYTEVEARVGLGLPRPAFGENIIATGIREESVYVGDRFRVGSAVICVTQPTERCRTIGRSLAMPRILRVLHELEVCGFYARVLEPGRVAPGDRLVLLERPQAGWSIKRLHRLMFHGLGTRELLEEALAIEQLSSEWKERAIVMGGRLRRGEPLNSSLAEV